MKTIHSSLLLITALAIGLCAQAASAVTITWNAATGSWHTAENWNPGIEPVLNTDDVVFNNGGSLDLYASRNVNTYNQTGGSFTTHNVGLQLFGNSSLAGGGSINFSSGGFGQGIPNVVFTVTNGTIRGFGETGNGLSLVNGPAGIVQADVAGQPLNFFGTGTFTNNGLMRATNGGRLQFTSSADVINNSTIRAQNGSQVEIYTRIVGGTLDNAGSSGIILLSGGGILRNVTIGAGSTVTDNNNGRLEESLVNLGTLSLPSNSLGILTNTTLTGGGTIALTSGTIYDYAQAGQTLTNTNNTIRGNGNIGFYGLSLVNDPGGIIQADVAGQTTLDLNGGGTFTNNGLMRAVNGGVLSFSGSADVINNSTIRSENGSGVFIFTRIVGGTLDNAGSSGTIYLSGGGILRNVTIGAGSTVTDNNNGRLEESLVNLGTLSLPSNSLGILTNTTLTGGGTIALTSGTIYDYAQAGQILTNTNNTIRGNGNIGFYGLSLVNGSAGNILADVSGQTLYLNGSGTFTNNGLMRALNGATLYFENGNVNNTGGKIEAVPGSVIASSTLFTQSAGTVIVDGTMNIPGGVDLNGGQLIGNGTFNGPIRNNGGIVSPGHSAGKITVNGNYTQGANGVLNIEIGGAAPGTEYDQLQVSGTATLGGTLNVTLINGFQPEVGDVFKIIAPNAFAGAFATINTTGFTADLSYSSGGITLTVKTLPNMPLNISNISTRMNVGTDPNQLIGGFIITGSEPKKVIVLATGPSLAAFGLTGVLADPILELYQGNTLIASNDNWKIPAQAEIEATGLKPGHDLECALVRTLDPGAYTANVRGTNNGTGVGTVQIYDLAPASRSKLANISSRGFVQAADDKIMIAGFIIGGSGGANAGVVVRALGPSLSAFGIAGVLPDPTLEIKNANGSTLFSNDDWQQSPQAADISAKGLAPSDPSESAIALSLPDGAYTAIVRGKGGATGVAVVEVYNVD